MSDIGFRDVQKEKLAPPEEKVARLAAAYLPGVRSARRETKGVSTYVYRVETEAGAYYARFLPEDATFGVEVLVQKKLAELGVRTPKVLRYVKREPETGLSMVITEEMAGEELSPGSSTEVLRPVLREAGRQLKKLHSLPVEGFGWIDRRFETQLRGEHRSYRAFFEEFLESDLAVLETVLPAEAAARLRVLTKEALRVLETQNAVLVHGDFCMEHIFHAGSEFTGFIDFGEIRGSDPYLDLGAFVMSDETPGGEASKFLLEGYGGGGSVDLRAVHLSALCFALRYAAKKAATPAAAFWQERLQKEMRALGAL